MNIEIPKHEETRSFRIRNVLRVIHIDAVVRRYPRLPGVAAPRSGAGQMKALAPPWITGRGSPGAPMNPNRLSSVPGRRSGTCLPMVPA